MHMEMHGSEHQDSVNKFSSVYVTETTYIIYTNQRAKKDTMLCLQIVRTQLRSWDSNTSLVLIPPYFDSSDMM